MPGLLSNVTEALANNTLPLGVFSDEEIFALERRNLFTRSWCYLAHESEIQKSGDFVVRYILDDSFIVCRDKQNQVQVLLNACRHRGLPVCNVERGQSSQFQCSYHGWIYGLNGELIHVHERERIYTAETLPEAEWGLITPKFGIWNGMIFANLDPDAPDLLDALGDARWYLEFYTNKSKAGLEVVGVPQRWVVNANWKLASDNFVGDGYHTYITHASTMSAGVLPAAEADFLMDGIQVALDNFGVGFARQNPLFNSLAYPEEMLSELRSNLADDQVEILDRGISLPTHATLFPNLSFLNAPGVFSSTAPPAPYLTMRVWRPISATKTEIWSWCMVESDAPQSFKDTSYKAYLISFGASGTLEQDDTENWQGITRAAKGTLGSKMYLNYSMGEQRHQPMEDWPGPGKAYPMDYSEFAQRAFWRTWLAQLKDPA